MFADTHNRKTIEDTICKYFGISKNELNSFESKIDPSKAQYDIEQFIGEHIPRKKIDSICFFHLSRTLNSEKNHSELLNLFDLLTTENSFTQFFSEHNVTFDGKEGKIFLYYGGKGIPINTDELNNYRPRLKKDLGIFLLAKIFV